MHLGLHWKQTGKNNDCQKPLPELSYKYSSDKDKNTTQTVYFLILKYHSVLTYLITCKWVSQLNPKIPLMCYQQTETKHTSIAYW